MLRITKNATLIDTVVTILDAKLHWPLQPMSDVVEVGEATSAYNLPRGIRVLTFKVEEPERPGLSIENSVD